MAGHSKWANIKHRKAAQDAKKGKVFTRLIRELVVAAKTGGGSAEDNPRLRAAIEKALSANMTKDTIDRAIKRGAGNDDNNQLDEIIYEGYGSAGVAILVECLTDNRNRTVSEVRHIFSKYGGNLGTTGSVSYLFNKKGRLSLGEQYNESDLLDIALEAGADDVQTSSHNVEIITEWTELFKIKEIIENAGFKVQSCDIEMIPTTKVPQEGEQTQKLIKMLDSLEELDDVQNIYTNADIKDLSYR